MVPGEKIVTSSHFQIKANLLKVLDDLLANRLTLRVKLLNGYSTQNKVSN